MNACDLGAAFASSLLVTVMRALLHAECFRRDGAGIHRYTAHASEWQAGDSRATRDGHGDSGGGLSPPHAASGLGEPLERPCTPHRFRGAEGA